MPSIYRVIKTVYHGLIPVRYRGPLHNENTWIGRRSLSMLAWLESRGKHDEIYDDDYYRRIVDPDAVNSASHVARFIVQEFHPQSIIDVGCGSGAMLAAFKSLGVRTFGVDYSASALAFCRKRGLDVEQFDLESDKPLQKTAAIAFSTEVAEHLPAAYADRFVSVLCSIAPLVIVTAATPGQGGTDHVNEQPNSYWIEKFEALGYQYLNQLADRWRQSWRDAGVGKTYYANVMVFSRQNLGMRYAHA